jgi:DNA-binding MarR family transcriptional regulator
MDATRAPDQSVASSLRPVVAEQIPFGHSVGFLLSQLGYAVTRRFGSELGSLAIEPRHFGLLRSLKAVARPSQQALGESLHIPPSSVVALLDQMEQKGLVQRRLDPADRRVRLVELTEEGNSVLARAMDIAIAIEETVCAGWDTDERESMIAKLQQVARNMGLVLGVHPGGTEAP